MDNELPEVGTPIYLVLGEGVNFRSRLESVDGDTFEVAAPLETEAAVLAPGHEFDIFWVPPRTRMVMPCRLVAVSDGAPFRWTLTATAGPVQSNRREFVRGGAGATVRLEFDEAEKPVEGALLDISEGGLRCWVDEPVKLGEGDRVTATVWLGTGEVELGGTVHTVRPAPDGDPGQHVILTFGTQENVAQTIRQYILAWEIGERRLAGKK